MLLIVHTHVPTKVYSCTYVHNCLSITHWRLLCLYLHRLVISFTALIRSCITLNQIVPKQVSGYSYIILCINYNNSVVLTLYFTIVERLYKIDYDRK